MSVKQFFTFSINLKVQAISMHITNTVLPRCCRYGVLTVKTPWYILCNLCKHTLHFKYKFHLQKLFCIKKEKACNAIKHSAVSLPFIYFKVTLSSVTCLFSNTFSTKTLYLYFPPWPCCKNQWQFRKEKQKIIFNSWNFTSRPIKS